MCVSISRAICGSTLHNADTGEGSVVQKVTFVSRDGSRDVWMLGGTPPFSVNRSWSYGQEKNLGHIFFYIYIY